MTSSSSLCKTRKRKTRTKGPDGVPISYSASNDTLSEFVRRRNGKGSDQDKFLYPLPCVCGRPKEDEDDRRYAFAVDTDEHKVEVGLYALPEISNTDSFLQS